MKQPAADRPPSARSRQTSSDRGIIGASHPVRDAVKLAKLSVAYLLTALIPKSVDGWLSVKLGNAKLRFQPRATGPILAQMERLLGSAAEGLDLPTSAAEVRRMSIEGRWGGFRGMHRRAWRPNVQLDGVDTLQEALGRGQGVILWRMTFGPTEIPKMALWDAGFEVVHLSTAGHGASGSWLGRHLLAPLVARAENWYLAERIVIPRDEALGYMRELMECLKENRVVSMYGDRMARQNIVTPFFTGTAAFATGAPTLAHRLGSALLPVSAIREGPNQYRVTIHPSIEIDRNLSRDEFVEQSIEEFSMQLQARILENPDSWSNWLMRTNWGHATESPGRSQI